MHEVPSLPYKYNELEPYIDEETMRLHHIKHHQAYVDKLNVALEDYPDLAQKPIADLVVGLNEVPEAIRTAVRNYGGGHLNHSLFWETIGPVYPASPAAGGGQPREATITLFDKYFLGLDGFRQKFKESALGLFGSGWTWLVLDSAGRPEITNTPNQDSPPGGGKTVLLCLDLWEHAYYLKYQNRRPEYVDAFFHIVNWQHLEDLLRRRS